MTLQDAIRDHLQRNGCSMRALSLEAGLGEKAVADILSGKSRAPEARTVEALARIIGVDASMLAQPQATWLDHLRSLESDPPADWTASKLTAALRQSRWFLRHMDWRPETQVFDRAQARRALHALTAAEARLSPGSLSVYRSNILAGLAAGRGGRTPCIRHATGTWRALHAAIGERHPRYRQLEAGSFLAWCDQRRLAPRDVDEQVFADYHADRLADGRKAAEKVRRHVASVGSLWSALAADADLSHFGCRPVGRLFPDGRDKFGVDAAAITQLLEEFDTRLAPWALGEATPEGLSYQEVLALLDRSSAPACPKRARLQALVGRAPQHQRNEREAAMAAHGLLIGAQRWNPRTLATRRGYVIALAKALYARAEYAVESLAELTDPLVLEGAATALDEARLDDDDLPSGYVASVLKTMKKIARGFCRREDAEIEAIAALISGFDPGGDGICERNRAKLKTFTSSRIDAFLDMSGVIVAEVNDELRRRKARARRGTGVEIVDAALARQVEIAVAHDIMVARPPRISNLREIRLDNIRRDGEGGAVISIPPETVKGRTAQDRALEIPLGPQQTRLLDAFVETFRPRLLAADDETNPYLFPSRLTPGRCYSNLGKALVDAVHARVGARLHPHLYRHLVGWIWLRDDPDKLPAVQRLLGHKRLETTLEFYAELDESLALQKWNDHVEKRRTAA